MKLIILSAGIGSRLQPITNKKPKCLLNMFNGKTLIENQLHIFKDFDICVVIGYMYEQVIPILNNYNNVTYIINHDYNNTNNMYSLHLAKKFINNEPFFVLNGDIFIEDTIHNIINKMNFNVNNIFIDNNKYNNENMKVVVNNNNIIRIDKSISKLLAYGLSIDFYYIYNYKEFFYEIINHIKHNKNEWAELILQKLMDKKYKFFPLNINNIFWYEIDNINDYINCNNKYYFYKNKIKKYDKYYFDIDGTLLLENKIINGVNDLFKNINNIKLLTNNSSNTKDHYIDIFNKYDIKVSTNMIINSIDTTIQYLKNYNIKNIYLFSNNNVKNIFKNHNFNIINYNDRNKIKIDIVVLTYNNSYTYTELKNLIYILSNNDINYICSHADELLPTEYGFLPDIGYIINMINKCTNKNPTYICGKPNVIINNNNNIIMIGDNINTDYNQSNNWNCDFCLTLSGRTNIIKIEEIIHKIKNIMIVYDINHLNKLFMKYKIF
jgi:HAD superfamily hydrolase (TIGR01450 family)